MSENKNIPKGCKPFDLEKAMAGEPVVTRDGRPYKFGAYNPDAGFPIVGWIETTPFSHKEDGRVNDLHKMPTDIFMAAKTQKVWVNLLLSKYSGSICSSLCTDEESVMKDRNNNNFIFLKTIEAEVEL